MEALGRPELWTIRTHLFPSPFSIANSSARGFRWIQDMQSLSEMYHQDLDLPSASAPAIHQEDKPGIRPGCVFDPIKSPFFQCKNLWFFSKFRCRSRSNPGDSPIFCGVLVHPTPKKNIASVLVFCYLVHLYIK